MFYVRCVLDSAAYIYYDVLQNTRVLTSAMRVSCEKMLHNFDVLSANREYVRGKCT